VRRGAGRGARVVLGMVQADRDRVLDFMRDDGNVPRVLVVRSEVARQIAPRRRLCARAWWPAVCLVAGAGGALYGLLMAPPLTLVPVSPW
jgi:hypothetical protein